jgi:hypothetical protein
MICTTPMCTDGKASVDQMNATFNDLVATHPEFNASQFQPTVKSITDVFNATYSFYDPYIPFNPVCCTIADIGAQADALTNEMLASVGGAPIPGPSTQTDPLGMLLVIGGIIAAVMLIREVRR